MIKFDKWLHVPGRGWTALCKSDDPDEDWVFLITMMGREVKIMDRLYKVIGIEGSKGLSRGPDMGIVVRGTPWEGKLLNSLPASSASGYGVGSQINAPDGVAND